jgi:hypothetical protein
MVHKLLEDRPYSFTEIFNLNIPSADLVPALGYKFERQLLKFPDLPTVDVTRLEQEFNAVLPYVDLNNEQARRETLVSSVVKFLVMSIQCRLTFEYGIGSERFYGNVDYFLQHENRLVVVEAKRNDLDNGFNQLAAQLATLDQGDYVDAAQTVLTGFVTTGVLWLVVQLYRQSKTIVLSLRNYTVPEDLKELLPLLLQALNPPKHSLQR